LSGDTVVAAKGLTRREALENEFFSIGKEEDYHQTLLKMETKNQENVHFTVYSSKQGNLSKDITFRAYPDFGLFLYTSPLLYLALRCWPGRKPFLTGHMHNDQLSMELVIDGKEIITDPGTYLYTPLPEIRNAYRSRVAHVTPCPIPDKRIHCAELFSLPGIEPAQIILANERKLCARCSFKGGNINRNIRINKKLRLKDSVHTKKINLQDRLLYSPGYGIVIKSPV
jgi:hypothetical protein